MGGELELIRAFRAEDGVVDASSSERARAALLEHIAGAATGERGARRRWSGRRVIVIRIRAEMIAVALAVLAVVGVSAVVLGIGSKRPARPARHAVAQHQQSLVIRNFSPSAPPALPGRMVCIAELTRPGLGPGGLFWPTTCQSQSLGVGGWPHGIFHATLGKVDGVSEYRFSITADRLPPNTSGNVYAVWLLQAAVQGGLAGSYRLLEPHRPQLLGVIEPGIARDGKLAAEGLIPPELLGSDYLLLITLQPHRSAATPGRTVLHGFVSLRNAGS
jgi:hypothetical protein